MRWERLFADLEAQEAGQALRQQESNIAEMSRLLASEGTLQENLLDQVGQRAHVHVAGRAGVQHLEVTGVGKDWFSGRENGREVLVQNRHLVSVEPSAESKGNAGRDPRVLTVGFRSTLRELARQRVIVEVSTLVPEVLFTGTIDRVGLDFCVLSQHDPDEFRRARAIRAVQWLALSHITQVSSWR
ncbi:hypothetical protein [Micrococcoides hystricis]|uniref:Uncharacterized protein n=1 Tax=Micrococcoides hystricis TaxID=1572761 RepID=A0ABV6PAA2_9MICC